MLKEKEKEITIISIKKPSTSPGQHEISSFVQAVPQQSKGSSNSLCITSKTLCKKEKRPFTFLMA